MTANQALRFVGLGLGSDPGGTGLLADATGALATVSGDDSVRQAIMLLLTTSPGERLMRPDYGSHLHRLVFAPNDQTTAGLAIHYVRSALTRWEPRAEIVDLDAGPDSTVGAAGRQGGPGGQDEPGRLIISLVYRVRSTLTTDLLELTIPLGGAT